jgi:hypothetical protein
MQDVMVLDFAHAADTIKSAFEDSLLSEETDPNKLYDLRPSAGNSTPVVAAACAVTDCTVTRVQQHSAFAAWQAGDGTLPHLLPLQARGAADAFSLIQTQAELARSGSQRLILGSWRTPRAGVAGTARTRSSGTHHALTLQGSFFGSLVEKLNNAAKAMVKSDQENPASWKSVVIGYTTLPVVFIAACCALCGFPR